MFKFRKPSPALTVALIALFVALSGTAIAASPIVAHARFADNAGKLQGKTSAALVKAAAALGASAGATLPGPASTAKSLISVKTQPYSLNPSQQNDYTTTCDGGAKAIAGGVDESNGTALPFDTRPSADGLSWQLYLVNFSDSAPASGTLYAICIA